MAQIAITSFSLGELSQVHWTARAFFAFSLATAIMAVYYASTQYRTLCRCVHANDIRKWIKGSISSSTIIIRAFNSQLPLPLPLPGLPLFRPRAVPQSSVPAALESISIPSAASVITISAPFMLLSAALNSFLIGFGIWLGFVWTNDLNRDAAPGDSLAVFITYVVGLGIGFLIYSLANISASSARSLYTWTNELSKRVQDRKEHDLLQGGHHPEHSTFGISHIGQTLSGVLGSPGASTSRTTKNADVGDATLLNEELARALRHAAELRRTLAESEEHLALLYDRLGQ